MTAVVQQQQHQATGVRAGDAEDEALINNGGAAIGKYAKYLYGKANFYINQSRQYFPHKKFNTFAYFPYHFIVYPIVFVISFPAIFNFISALLMAAVNALFLLMYMQHLYVIVTTMRHVVKQQTIPNITSDYDHQHLEISQEAYRAQYARCEQEEVGVLMIGSGKVKLQVFRKKTMALMKKVMVVSCLLFAASLFMVFCCLGIGISGIVIIAYSYN